MKLWEISCFLALSVGLIVTAKEDQGDDHEENEADHEEKPHWSYVGPYGPENWGAINELCLPASTRQSPINIEPMKAVFEDDLNKIYLEEHYSKYRKYNIKNNGHSVNIEIDHEVLVKVGDLSKGYRVAGIHFHWGSNDHQGSEHTVDNRRFPLEMHMVTYDAARYETLGDAVFGDDSLAVLGTMFKISDDDNPVMDFLIDGLRDVREPGDKGKIRAFPVSELLPAQTDKYFRYLGSLTTPPCAESVIWTLFLHTQYISSKQLVAFRHLTEGQDDEGHDHFIEDNWRPIQSIYERVVYRSFMFKSEMSKAIVNYGKEAQEGHGAAPLHTLAVLTIITSVIMHLV